LFSRKSAVLQREREDTGGIQMPCLTRKLGEPAQVSSASKQPTMAVQNARKAKWQNTKSDLCFPFLMEVVSGRTKILSVHEKWAVRLASSRQVQVSMLSGTHVDEVKTVIGKTRNHKQLQFT
jgi:hypothetical protein